MESLRPHRRNPRRTVVQAILVLFLLLYAAVLLMAPCCGSAARAMVDGHYSPACVPPPHPTPSVTTSPPLATITPQPVTP